MLEKSIRRKLISYLIPSGFYFSHKGHCPCCDQDVIFQSSHDWLRDHLICNNCFSIPRERALMVTIEKYFPNWQTLRIHESSPVNRGTSLKLKTNCRDYIASQYYPNHPFGSIIDAYRNEDLENQTFSDAFFDLVVTQDVMEHIYNPEKAFSEIARTLKKGGAHIFTVPLVNKHNRTEVWATQGKDGQPIFASVPEYHGNPVDPKGSPVTMHWGFDIINSIRNSSGLDTIIEYIDDLHYGIRAEYIEVLVSQKRDNE